MPVDFLGEWGSFAEGLLIGKVRLTCSGTTEAKAILGMTREVNPKTPTHRRARRPAAWAVVTLTAVLGTLLATATPADAAPKPKERGVPYTVTFGDSYTANNADSLDIPSVCRTSPTSWPAQLHRRTGRPVMNLACSGSKLTGAGYTVYDQARKAVARGGLNGNTRAVLVQLGFNDFNGGTSLYRNCFTVGCPGNGYFPGLNAANYAQKLRPLVEYVRFYAPRAEISIVGYPEVFGANDKNICANVAGARVVLPNTTAAPVFMKRLQAAQQGAATRLGIGFVDLRAATSGHSLCSAQPWVNGIFNPNPGIRETVMVGHPTVTGDAVAARTVARAA